jgi:hypothetical protein
MRLPLLPLLLLAAAAAAAEEPVYKSVDADGNVTYSKQPPPEAVQTETVDLPPAPTAEQVRDAEEQARAVERSAATLEQERKQREAAAQPAAPATERIIERRVYIPAPVVPDLPVRPLPPQPPLPSPPPGGKPPRPRPR